MLIHRIVLMESDKVRCQTWHDQLSKEQFQVTSVAAAPESFQEMAKNRADIVIASAECLEGPVAEAAEEMLNHPASPLLLVAADTAQLPAAAEWVHRGAFDFLSKPTDFPQWQVAFTKADRFLRSSLRGRDQLRTCLDAPVLRGTSPAVGELRQTLRKFACTQATVLIQGEPGTGHESVAAALHNQSNRSKGPFLCVDCAGSSPADLQTEIFGGDGWISKLIVATGGTLVLEEVAQLDLSLQERLLRFCQSSTVDFRGRTVNADVRIIATSSTPLEPKMNAGLFREDLFFRLDMARLDLPPLRERISDIAEIATGFREYYAQKYGLGALALSPEAQLALTQHAWPGNLRELEQVIDRAVLRCGPAAIIQPEHLGLSVTSAVPASPLIDSLQEVEKNHILAVLDRCDGNRTHASARLGISIRTLRNKLREFRLAAAAAA
jgi:DNA-binding NtrC family response regulator